VDSLVLNSLDIFSKDIPKVRSCFTLLGSSCLEIDIVSFIIAGNHDEIKRFLKKFDIKIFSTSIRKTVNDGI
jgi:hypothetical protein